MTKIIKTIFLLAISYVFIAFPSNAAWWNPVSWFEKKGPKRAETLVVTGNYVKSRILAELIQVRSDQPILLLPGKDGSETMFFIAPTDDTLEVKKEDYLRFINFLNPKRVLFLGNELYTPTEYVEPLKDRLPIWSVTNNDWKTIALSVEELLKIKHLGYDYLVLINQLDDKGQLKPAASTEEFGGYRTNRKYWNPSE